MFVLRAVAYPFNAKQSADMQRRHPKVTREMHEKMKAKVEVRRGGQKRVLMGEGQVKKGVN